MLYGTEIELATIVLNHGAKQVPHAVTSNDITTILERRVPWGMNRIGQFYQNGMRAYDDHTHLEISSAECNNLDDMLAEEHAVEAFACALGAASCGEGPDSFKDLHIYKRAIDSDGNTTGAHESYLLRRSKELNRYADPKEVFGVLGTFLSVRNLFAGGGAITPEGTYSQGQKSYTLRTDYNSTTMDHKPVVNLRDAPLSNNNKWFRLHVVSGDPNMSPWALRMKIGTTALVAELVQHGVRVPTSLRPATGIVRLARNAAEDIRLENSYLMANGEEMTIQQINKALCLFTRQEIQERRDLTEEDKWVFDTWADVADNPRRYVRKIDWMLKLKLIESKIGHTMPFVENEDGEKQYTPLPDDELEVARDMDMRYTELGDGTIAANLRKKSWLEDMPKDPEKTTRFKTSPPQTTRAAARGAFIAAKGWPHRPRGTTWRAKWNTVTSVNGETIMIDDPTRPTGTTYSDVRL